MSSKNKHNKQGVDRAGQNDVGSMDERIENAKKEAGLRNEDPLTIRFESEAKYVRRTAAEFHAGAEPLRPSQDSHRMTRTSLQLSPEMIKALKKLGSINDLDRMKLIRAAIRFALRHPDLFDPNEELQTEFTVSFEDGGWEISDPK